MTSSVMPELGPSKTPRYEQHYEITSQFEAADRIAETWGLTRDDLDEYAVRSQSRAADAIAAARFTSQIVPVAAPVLDADGAVTGTAIVDVDEGPARRHARGWPD